MDIARRAGCVVPEELAMMPRNVLGAAWQQMAGYLVNCDAG